AKARADFAKQKLKLTLARKALQERVATAIEGVQSASVAFQTTLDDLKPFAIELGLRVKDGTLTEDKLPAHLTAEALSKRRENLVAAQDKLKTKLTAARKADEVAAKLLSETEKSVVGAEAEATEASRVYAREQQRKELEKKYAGKNTDE